VEILNRANRYYSIWEWIVSLSCRVHPWMFISAVFFGVCARLGVLVGFIATIKAAIWIINPESFPSSVIELFGLSQGQLYVVLVAVPCVCFLLKAFAQILHSRISLKLRSSIAQQLAVYSANQALVELPKACYMNLKDTSNLATKLRTDYTQLFTAQQLLINVIVLAFVLLLSVAIGLLLDRVIVTVLVSILLVLGIVFINYKHKKSLELTKSLLSSKDDETMTVRRFAHQIADNESIDGADEILHEFAGMVKRSQLYGQRFDSSSVLVMDVAQAFIVAGFLIILGAQGSDESRLTELALLAVLFRFLISYTQAIIQAIIKLSPYYSLLQKIKLELESRVRK